MKSARGTARIIPTSHGCEKSSNGQVIVSFRWTCMCKLKGSLQLGKWIYSIWIRMRRGRLNYCCRQNAWTERNTTIGRKLLVGTPEARRSFYVKNFLWTNFFFVQAKKSMKNEGEKLWAKRKSPTDEGDFDTHLIPSRRTNAGATPRSKDRPI